MDVDRIYFLLTKDVARFNHQYFSDVNADDKMAAPGDLSMASFDLKKNFQV